jgi:CcmD family protein
VTRRMLRVIAVTLVIVSGFGQSVADQAVTLLAQGQPKQQEEFTPIDQLPPQEQLPAAPLLVGAYVFVLLTLFGYMFMMSRRMTFIQREVDRLDNDMKRSGRS